MLTKDSPEVQDLLSRIQQVVPGLNGPVCSLSASDREGVVIKITYDQDAPTEELRQLSPGQYSLILKYDIFKGKWVWLTTNYGYGMWCIPTIEADDFILGNI